MNEPVAIPEWVSNLVGRLALENELLRRTLGEQEAELSALREAQAQSGVSP